MGLMKFGDKSPEATEGKGELESVVQKAINEYMRRWCMNRCKRAR